MRKEYNGRDENEKYFITTCDRRKQWFALLCLLSTTNQFESECQTVAQHKLLCDYCFTSIFTRLESVAMKYYCVLRKTLFAFVFVVFVLHFSISIFLFVSHSVSIHHLTPSYRQPIAADSIVCWWNWLFLFMIIIRNESTSDWIMAMTGPSHSIEFNAKEL